MRQNLDDRRSAAVTWPPADRHNKSSHFDDSDFHSSPSSSSVAPSASIAPKLKENKKSPLPHLPNVPRGLSRMDGDEEEGF